jgi:tetratricopeptide (TPR) repeat protein
MGKIKLLIVGLVLFLSSSICYAADVEWIFPYTVAQKMAEDEGKILLVVAMTEWEQSSKTLLNKTFNEESIVNQSKDFILTQIGVTNKDFIEQYKIRRFPTVIFLKKLKEEWVEVDRLVGEISEGILLIEMRNVLADRETYFALNEKVKREPDNKKALLKLALICQRQEKIEQAIKNYTHLIELEPKKEYSLELDYLRALQSLVKKDFYNTKVKFKKFLKDYPKSKYEEKARFYLINSYIALSQIDEAFKEINSYLKDFPQSKHNPFLIYTLGEYYFTNGFLKNGTRIFIELIKGYPETQWAGNAQSVLEDLIAWPRRRLDLRLKKKVVDVVYVVEDIETFLYYLSKWKEDKIFPILFSDSKLTEKFIKAFKPSEVIRPEPVKIGDIDEQIILRALYASWGDEDIFEVGQIDRDQIKKRLTQVKGVPLGIVFTRPLDDEMAGGLALAAARGEILEFLPYSFKYGRVLNYEQKEEIRRQVRRLIVNWDIPFEGLLEGIDFITIACDLAYTYIFEATPNAGRYSLDDAINRDDNGDLYALTGRLLGPKDKALYQAMCAIFLQPKKALFFNTYATDSEPWSAYGTKKASKVLSGFIQSQSIEKEATLEKWHSLMKEGSNYNLIFVNSWGGGYDWNTRSGTGSVEDVPETVPAIVYFTQSGSATDPKNTETICGKWLENGAYIYYGAVAEPFVQAFNPPRAVVEDLLFGHTYAYAFRKQTGSWSNPWRLIYIGDPMAYFEGVAVERIKK